MPGKRRYPRLPRRPAADQPPRLQRRIGRGAVDWGHWMNYNQGMENSVQWTVGGGQ